MELIKTIDMLSRLFDYTADKSNDIIAGEIINKLGIDNPHIAITRTEENWKSLIDKMLFVKKLTGEMK